MEPRNLYALLLRSKNLTTNGLSEKLGGKVEQSQLNRFETGKTREPRRSTLQPVADYFGMPVEVFYSTDLAAMVAAKLGAGVPMSEIFPDKTQPLPQAVKDLDQGITEGRVTSVPIGAARARRWEPNDPERLVLQFKALLLKLPEANRLAAAQAAYQAMVPYILEEPMPEQGLLDQ